MRWHLRTLIPEAVYHFIARFVGGAYRLDGDGARTEYLRRLGQVAAGTDWRVLGYALMSNHVHLCALAGKDPPAALIQPLHGAFARWLNRRQGTFGVAFAERFSTVICRREEALRVIAYLHNNPVRARVVERAADSTWTSHRAYVGLAPVPHWLRVDVGLRLSGFGGAPDGRSVFDAAVDARSGAPRDPLLAGDGHALRRALARAAVAAPVELGSTALEGDEYFCDVRAREATPIRVPWPGGPDRLLRLVADESGIAIDALRSRGRRREVVEGRRLALGAWVRLGRPLVEMSSALGISQSAATQLVHSMARPRFALEQRVDRVVARAMNG